MTRIIPKEMVTVVDRSVIQFVASEEVQAGCNALIFVTEHSNCAIEDYFDVGTELENKLSQKNNQKALDLVQSIIPPHLQYIYIRQVMPLDLGRAVLRASGLIEEGEIFAILLPDDLIDSHEPRGDVSNSGADARTCARHNCCTLSTSVKASKFHGFAYRGQRFDYGSRPSPHRANLHFWARFDS